MRQILFVLPLLAILLGGCDSTTVVHAVDNDTGNLRLEGFFLVDSFGTSNEYSAVQLELDPYHNDGVFDLYWDVDSYYDYSVTISVNDRPDIYGATILSSEVCGPDLWCDYTGQQICQYFEDYTMGCGLDLWEAEQYRESVDHLVETEPDTLFINIEVCDEVDYYCELDSIEVLAF